MKAGLLIVAQVAVGIAALGLCAAGLMLVAAGAFEAWRERRARRRA